MLAVPNQSYLRLQPQLVRIRAVYFTDCLIKGQISKAKARSNQQENARLHTLLISLTFLE